MDTDLIPFNIREHSISANCDEKVLEFIIGNLKFLNKELSSVREEVFNGSELTFVCYETTVSFGAKLNYEDGLLTEGQGVMRRGVGCDYDLLLEKLS